MSNAAISYYPDAYDTALRLMGRQSAGESFLRGFIRHGDVDQFYFANWMEHSQAKADAVIRRIQPTDKPINWIPRSEFRRVSEPGCLFVSAPANAQEAWNRRAMGPSLYSICGLTHTTASAQIMDAVISMLLSPVEPWDALICTSRAVRQSLSWQLNAAMDFLQERFGRLRPVPLRLETIPLGINTDDFQRSDEHRAYWRKRLGVADDGIVVLYVGRFSPHAKMHSIPMALALEKAARRTKRPIHWILSGWGGNPYLHELFTEAGPRFAPSVKTHVLDGREAEVRFPIWSAGDVFLSLSDNIQETFGLTPVEAMAAGLPCVISDWDGYRDLVRDGVDGFRIPTVAPAPGGGQDLAMGYANTWLSYDHYVGTTSLCVSADIAAAADALHQLFENEDLRLRMGKAAQERARSAFDWKTVIGQYQGLWADLAAVRTAAPPKAPKMLNPWRPDPYRLFAGYPTAHLPPDAVVALSTGTDLARIDQFLRERSVAYAADGLLKLHEFEPVLEALTEHGPLAVRTLSALFPPPRQGVAERSLIWLAKFGLVSINPLPRLTLG